MPTAYIWACRVGAAGAMEIIHPRIVPKMCFYTSERWRTGSGKMDGFAHGGNMGALYFITFVFITFFLIIYIYENSILMWRH